MTNDAFIHELGSILVAYLLLKWISDRNQIICKTGEWLPDKKMLYLAETATVLWVKTRMAYHSAHVDSATCNFTVQYL